MKRAKLLLLFVPVYSTSLYGQQTPDFSNFVVVGDSLSAGFQNAQLINTGQENGYAQVITNQVNTTLPKKHQISLYLPLLAPPGYPQITIEGGEAVVTDAIPPALWPTPETHDLAVPGYTLEQLVSYSPVCITQPSSNVIGVLAAGILNPKCANNPLPELTQAANLKPTTSILWIGANDALFNILYGAPLTNIGTFAETYNTAITTMAQSSKTLIVANIPDVTLAPYLTSVTALATILNAPVLYVEEKLGLFQGDMVTPYAFTLIESMGTNLTPLPNALPNGYPVVVRYDTILQIRATIEIYNLIIAIEAAANHATLVDIYTLVNNLAANGIVVNGTQLTTAFGGGLFSLDGIHPTDVGYAIIANQFISTMNSSSGTNIPQVSLAAVAKIDPLFPKLETKKTASHVSSGMAAALRMLNVR
jgi:lysophospholipase L1-like esterase